MDIRIFSIVFFCLFSAAICYQARSELPSYTDHPCIRPCTVGQPMNCTYYFQLEHYFTLTKSCFRCPFNTSDCFRRQCISANGVSRAIVTVNRMLPGPGIHVCKGDNVIVNVFNDLKNGEGTSIHWHGILQHGSQHMDGAGMITQCPIHTKMSFEYRFKAENYGTHFWHAHSGQQRADGIFGALVVRQADENEPHVGLYEDDLPEHTMVITEWIDEMSIDKYSGSLYADVDDEPESILVNGKGKYKEVTEEEEDDDDDEEEEEEQEEENAMPAFTPVEVFHVTAGRRYRFRAISAAAMNCPIQISVDNHTMTVIASDGEPFEKIEVESFVIFAGERFDFILNASMPVNNYWIRYTGLDDCAEKNATQVAILRYRGAAEQNPVGTTSWEDGQRQGKILNPLNRNADDTYIPIVNLHSLVENRAVLKPIPDKKFYLALDFNAVDKYFVSDPTLYDLFEPDETPQINHISMVLPSSPPLYQHKDLNEDIYCNHSTLASRNCSAEVCECVHRLVVNLGDVVELVLISESLILPENHPMHLHGYRFFVVGMDIVGETTSIDDIRHLDSQGDLARNLVDPIAKDTVTVPNGGYTIVRFHADNPGIWLFHCHIQFHLSIGMALLLQVGGTDDMPEVPYDFPRCGNWKYTSQREVSDIDGDNRCVAGTSNLSLPSMTVMTMLVSVLVAIVSVRQTV